MADPYSEPMRDDGDPNALMTALVGLFGLALTALVIIWLISVYNRELEEEIQTKVVAARPAALGQYEAEQKTLLNSYGWVNESEGIVRIPIEQAMKLEVEAGRGPE